VSTSDLKIFRTLNSAKIIKEHTRHCRAFNRRGNKKILQPKLVVEITTKKHPMTFHGVFWPAYHFGKPVYLFISACRTIFRKTVNSTMYKRCIQGPEDHRIPFVVERGFTPRNALETTSENWRYVNLVCMAYTRSLNRSFFTVLSSIANVTQQSKKKPLNKEAFSII